MNHPSHLGASHTHFINKPNKSSRNDGLPPKNILPPYFCAEKIFVFTSHRAPRFYKTVIAEEIINSNSAMWFSPDAKKLAFATFNDTNVDTMNFPLYGRPGDAAFQYPLQQSIKYPKVSNFVFVIYDTIIVVLFNYNSMIFLSRCISKLPVLVFTRFKNARLEKFCILSQLKFNSITYSVILTP